MKKFLAVLLTSVMLLCAAPLSGFSAVDLPTLFDGLQPRAYAASGTCGTGVSWTLSNGVLSITGSGRMKTFFNFEGDFPGWLQSSILNSYSIKKIVVGSGVKNISALAFMSCSEVTSVEIAGSVEEIGFEAFAACPKLEKIVLPEGLTTLCRGAFLGCEKLKSIYIPSTVTDFCGPASLGSWAQSQFGSIEDLNRYKVPAVLVCPALEKIEVAAANPVYRGEGNCVIEKSTKTLILGCKNSAIPEDGSVAAIGAAAFQGCGINSVRIPASVRQIQASAFMGCDSLADVYYTGTQAQWNAITIEESNEPLTSATLHCAATAPDTNTIVASGACGDKGDNVKWTLDSDGTLTITGSGKMKVFFNSETDLPGWLPYVDSIIKLVVGSGVTNIPTLTFGNCGELASVDIAGTVKEIGCMVFWGAPLEEIVLPEGLTTLCRGSFVGCNNLKSIYIPGTVTELYAPIDLSSIGSFAFSELGEALTILAQTPVPAFATCPALEKIVVSAANSVYRETGNCLIAKSTKTLVLGCKNSVIPEDGSVVSIGAAAFSCCGINSVRIPASVRQIQKYAFEECEELTDVYYTGTQAQWNAITIEECNDPLTAASIHYAAASESYTVSFDANGGSGAPAAQTKTEGNTLTLSSVKPTKSVTITYDAKGGSMSTVSKTMDCSFQNWNTKQDGTGTSYAPGGSYTANASVTLYAQWSNPTFGGLPTPTRSGYTFDGWYTEASGGTKITTSSAVAQSQTVYAHWTSAQKNEYSVSYDANGGSGAPYGQTKTEGVSLTLSSVKPTKSYTIAYDANGGSVSTAFKTVSCTFRNWNTRSDGSGASYAPGGRYTADASVTLYAQWTNPTAGTLAAPTRSGYTFDGWYTEASGGTIISASSTVSQSQTV